MAIIQRQDASREPLLVPIRHGRMLRSPFAFFRGAAAIMAGDLARTPVTGITVQACGDAHAANFGVFAAPDRRLVFDINDFDETLPGPWEWDVKRLAASLAIAGRDRGFTQRARARTVLAAVGMYREAMRGFAGMRTIDVWYARVDVDDLVGNWSGRLSGAQRRRLDATIAKARRTDSLRALDRLTVATDGRPHLASDPPLVVPLAELVGDAEEPAVRRQLVRYLDQYTRTLAPDRRRLLAGYRPVDMAHKVVGVGSVGTRAWIVLLLGRDAADPLFLQLKEAAPSVLEPFLRPRRAINQGERVVEGQRLMQAASDVFLGWLRADDPADHRPRDYYVRQLWDAKASAPIDTMAPDELAAYARVCGWTLARAHARSGDRFAIAGYLGAGDRFDQAIAAFAETYADQNERDYTALVAAARAGAIEADPHH